MNKTSGKIILLVLLAIPIAWLFLWKNTQFGYNELPVYSTDEMGVQEPYYIDEFSLTDQNGKTFKREDIGDRVFVSSFFFASCPDVCPTINGHLKIATEKLKNSTDVLFLTHTVDPHNDSVSVLRKYADDFEARDEQWKFLTGNKSTIYQLSQRQLQSSDTRSSRH